MYENQALGIHGVTGFFTYMYESFHNVLFAEVKIFRDHVSFTQVKISVIRIIIITTNKIHEAFLWQFSHDSVPFVSVNKVPKSGSQSLFSSLLWLQTNKTFRKQGR